MNTNPPLQVLTPEKILRLFLRLPVKVLPLSKEERKLAIENEEITSLTEGDLTTVRWQSSTSTEDSVELKFAGYTGSDELIFRVVSLQSSPDSASDSRCYTYALTRIAKGWLIRHVN